MKDRRKPRDEFPWMSTKELRVILVRHGQAETGTDSDQPNQYNHPDPGLTKLGRVQARRLAKRFSEEHFAGIYCSDLKRAHQTALAVKVHHPKTKFVVDTKLREVSPYHGPARRAPSRGRVRDKVNQERNDVRNMWEAVKKKHKPGDHVLIVAHGNIIRFLAALMAGMDPKHAVFFDTCNASVTVLRAGAGNPEKGSRPATIVTANCLKHLLPHQRTNC